MHYFFNVFEFRIYRNDSMIIVVNAFFKTATFYPMQRSELFSKTDLIASCGGILGLFMGFSLLSVIEIVYFCTVRPLLLCRSRHRRKGEQFQRAKQIQNETGGDTVKKRQGVKFIEAPTYGRNGYYDWSA